MMNPKANPDTITEEERLQAMRAAAGWYLGDRSWANKLLGFYLHPRESLEGLRAEQVQYERVNGPLTASDT